jgi:hypothetical protein
VTPLQLGLCALTAILLYATCLVIQALHRRMRGYRPEAKAEKVKYPQKGW